MFDISKSDEARNLLAKDDFTIEDAKQVLLYLVERDEDTQNKFRVLGTILRPTLEALIPMFAGFKYVAIPDLDVRNNLKAAVVSLQEAVEILKTQTLIH